MRNKLMAATLLGLAGTVCQASTLDYTASIPSSATNWGQSLSFEKFDAQLGTLNAVSFVLDGTASGSGKTESLDATGSVVNLTLGSTLSLQRPDGSTLVLANPVFSRQFTLSPFDGSIDFSGSSGASTGSVTASQSGSFSSSSASDLALFSANGGGLIQLNLHALGASYASGGGNLLSQFNTVAGADIAVRYEYTPFAPVPEPATYAMLAAGLALVGMAGRRRRRCG